MDGPFPRSCTESLVERGKPPCRRSIHFRIKNAFWTGLSFATTPITFDEIAPSDGLHRTRILMQKSKQSLASFRGEVPVDERLSLGKALRDGLARESHGIWSRAAETSGAVEIVMNSNRGRQKDLVPLRLARMARSPFSFFRGAGAVMAADLARAPVTGIDAVIDGDAHLNNFGVYGSLQRDVIFDLNDFDEAVIGPWEWDLKRLTASVNLAARENGFNRRERDAAVRQSARGYRSNANRLCRMGILETWYLHAYPGRNHPLIKMDLKSRAIAGKVVAKAAAQTHLKLLNKVASREKNGKWRIQENPPVLTRVDKKTQERLQKALEDYGTTLPRERQFMLTKYRMVDVAHRVVGVGSVGTRAYLVLMFGNGERDPLFLQVKEATIPTHAPYLPPMQEEFAHQGKRVVLGQRALQASTDVMLGWTQMKSRPYYVRQMRNMTGSVPVEWLTGSAFNFYAHSCGAILARAHARTTDIAVIAGYCGRGSELDDALCLWAESYAEQTIKDHAALSKAVKNDRRVQALRGI